MSKFFLSICTLTLVITMTGCTLNGPANHEELCSQLRSQVIYNSIDHNITAKTTTDTQKQEIADKLKAANCNPA
jgi:hypothetical protein